MNPRYITYLGTVCINCGNILLVSYVVVSRVRTLDGLMFEVSFDRSRIYRDVPIRSMQLKLADYETRKLQALDAQAADHSGSFDGYTSSGDN